MTSGASVTKKACDGCKIRKIRCGGGCPCQSCSNAHIKCTYIRVQQARGPQRLRPMTKYLIEQAQRGIEGQSSRPLASSDNESPLPKELNTTGSENIWIPPNIFAFPLYTYHVRLYPVWPVVDVKNVMGNLQQNSKGVNHETYALATAVAAATTAQLRLRQNSFSNKPITAETFQIECGSESLLYLREAISLAQMMSLHRANSYTGLPQAEQQMRCRVLWLLFVTERGVCILHKLPVVLKTNVSTPELDAGGEPLVLPAFLKLLNLFRLFEQSKMFDIIESDQLEMPSIPGRGNVLDRKLFDVLHNKLRDGLTLEHISDVQKADLCVTRHWMRVILWRILSNKNIPNFSSHRLTSPFFPVLVAKELLNMISQLPRTAIEAHGLGMELKLYEIANSLADSIMHLAILPQAPVWDGDSRPSNILERLYSILSTFRGGGNRELAELLYKKMADAQCMSGLTINPALKDSHAQIGRKFLAETAKHSSNPITLVQDEATESSYSGSGKEIRIGDGTATELEHIQQLNGPSEIYDAGHQQVIGYHDFQQGEGLIPSSFSVAPLQMQPDHPLETYDSHLKAPLQSPWECLDAGDQPLSLPFLSSSLPSSSQQILVGNFMSDTLGNHFPLQNYLSTSHNLPDHPSMIESFLV
ncbi:Zn(II)2Cys6 transcription factor [Aspergillus tanneri]|uniref:Zn(2)-C6 fungal-type domain-containing protein n=1 Tax=Aspergillus tanneri TaxID=1220188 RepID=A0A5M9MKI8_9EURO|nr:uncharacterized protein ATNIH1004_009130 [Aspergillus tanneri]KAA8644919.1 hypothetical protein ATNIH1004_009130 [Aspergillus tanneri]